MRYQKPLVRSVFFIFLLVCLLTGLIGSVRVPAQAAPMMQTTVDLSLTLTVNNATPNKADAVVFTIIVTNNSTADIATGVTAQAVLPAGLAYVSDSSGGTYDNVSGNWVVGTVSPSSSVTLNIITNATTTGTKTVTAEILASTPPNSNTTNYSATVTVTPNASDIELLKNLLAGNANPSVGDLVTFRIVVNNLGPLNASGVRVNDLLPPGLSFISYTSSSSPSGSGGTYTSSTGNWSVGTLNVGVTKTLDIRASVTSAAAKTNTATVTESDQLDPATTNNSSSITLNSPVVDLAVTTMSVNNTTPNKSEDVIFTITVSNTGTNNATGVTVRDLLPTGMSYQSHSGGTYNSTTGIWSIGSMPSGLSDTLTITARATTTGVKTNVAEVWNSNQADSDSTPGNSVASEDDYASVTVTPRAADLSITKTIDRNAPNPGDTVRFTLTLNNAGPDAASGVTVLDSLPAGYTYVSDNGAGAYVSSTGTWTIGSMTANSNASLVITATTTSNSNKTNKAEVASSNQLDPDSTPGNNSVSEDDDDASPKVDLSLTKTVNNAVPAQGANIIFTLRVSNAGPAAATGVVVRDVLPLGLSYISDNGAGAYDSGSGLWTVGTLAVNASKTLAITVTAANRGAYSNYAQVWASDQYDIDSVPGDNSTTADDDESVAITVSYPAMTLLINEVAWMGTAASVNDEWIELYNPGSAPINLSDWVLRAVDGTPSITLLDGYLLQPGEYYLLERSDDTTVSDIAANQIYVGDLGNSSEILQLIDPLNRVVDTANSNGGIWPAGNSSTFGSMERRAGMVDSDTAWITNTGLVFWGKDAGTPNNCTTTTPTSCLVAPKNLKGTPKHANWANSVVPTPSPVATAIRTPTLPPPPPPPLIVINEFVPRPGHDWSNDGVVNTGDEYIELLNHGVIDVSLSGYKLDDEVNVGSPTFNLPSDITLKPGERYVFYGSQTGLLLSDGGDGVRLLKPNGQLMDAYNYAVVDFPDQSFCRLPDNGGADDWNTNCYPTPGLQNSLSGTVLRPPTQEDEDQPLCPVADTLPDGFVLAECLPFGNNIWSRYYWDQFGWYGGLSLPNMDSKWEVHAE
jgi:uncharacterized repeat protein (TIGR01451 family)